MIIMGRDSAELQHRERIIIRSDIIILIPGDVRGVAGNFKVLKVIYHPLYSMNKFVTNKSKLPQDEAQVFPYMG